MAHRRRGAGASRHECRRWRLVRRRRQSRGAAPGADTNRQARASGGRAMTNARRTVCGSLLALAWLSDGHAGARQATPVEASDVGPVLQVSVTGGFNGGSASGGLTLLADTWTEMAAHAGR